MRERVALIESYQRRFVHTLERAEQNDSRASSSWSHLGSSNNIQAPHNSRPDFDIVRKLGRGSYGEVDEIKEKSSGVISARKRVSLWGRPNSADLEEQVRGEYTIMRELTYRHIVAVEAFWIDEDGVNYSMRPVADQHLGIYLADCEATGYQDGALRSIIQWFGCLLDALAFAHRREIAHRDIKPSNILIKGGVVYLSDFGLAKDFKDLGGSGTTNAQVLGTPLYRAPEVKPNQKRGTPADVFSLGCVFSEMLTVCCGKSLDDYQNFRRVAHDEYPLAFRENLPAVLEWLRILQRTDSQNELCEDLISLIRKMIRDDPNQRIKAQAAYEILLRNTDNKHLLFCRDH